ncbi:MAG TPA: hypothetical protein VLX92_33335 [Kofleriaceae bacterium]|nr:hypothetical protein [Kofleriaceae bacterium]
MTARLLAAAIVLAACRHHPHVLFEGDDFKQQPVDDTADNDDQPPPEPPLPPRHLPVAVLDQEPGLAVSEIAPPTPSPMPWPLTEPPSSEPHLPAARARDACTAHKVDHRDVLAYVAAWCRLRAGDVSAIGELARLAASSRADVMAAALLDTIDRLAAGDADQALKLLRAARLVTPRAFELLAGTYIALHLPGQAKDVLDELRASRLTSSPAYACEHLAWDIVSPELPDRLAEVDQLDGPCPRRAGALACAMQAARRFRKADYGSRLVAMRECYRELPDDPARDAKLELLLVHARWGPRNPASWLELARHAEVTIGTPPGEAYTIAALRNAMLASDCDPDTIAEVAASAARIRGRSDREVMFDLPLDALATLTREDCVAAHPRP